MLRLAPGTPQRSPRAVVLAGLVVGLASVALGPAAQAQAPLLGSSSGAADRAAGWAAPRADGPRVRVLDEEPTSVTVEVTATWPTPLADAFARASAYPDGPTPATAVLAAALGHATVSHEVALGARVPPAVEVVSEDVEWVDLPAGVADRLAGLAGPAASVENVGELRRQLVGSLAVRVLRVEDGRLGRVRRVVVRVSRPALRVAFAGGAQNPHVAVTRSALAEGQWFRVAVQREGVYRLTAAFLRDSLGVDAADLGRVQVFGNGGRILPAVTSAPRLADLAEVPSLVSGDAVLFFAEGPSWWDFRPAVGAVPGYWQHDISPFSDATTYFVRVDGPAPRRLAAEPFPGWPDAERLGTVTDRYFHERDRYNHEREGSGSGLDWMGEELPRGGTGVAVLGVAPPGVVGPVRYRARVAGRSNPAITVTMAAGSEVLATVSPGAVDLTGSNSGNLLQDRLIAVERPSASDLGVTFRATGGNTSGRAWLDWAEAVVERAPVASGGAVRFATPGGRAGRFEVALQGFASAPEVWDVTEPGAVRRLGVQASGGEWLVQVEAGDRPREVVAFDAAGAYVSALPEGGAPVANQNLHGLQGSPDYVVVAHPQFAAAAERLAQYRREHDGLETVVVTTDQVFNEFASGAGDMRAVRDYMKFLYDRAATPDELPRYLLLFGDGHFDFRNIGTDVPNFVPVFETEEMFNRTNSYTSDDYFGLLADSAGVWSNNTDDERVQVGIGRLPVRTAEEAVDMVDKIELYEGPTSRGDWRTRATFVGDDQYPNQWDHDLHVLNADGTAETAAATDSTITLQKIYAPSYPLVTTAQGRRRPTATEAIVRSLNEGTLVWNYSGHGSPDNLGDERYLNEDVLGQLDNRARPAIFVTATCSFGKYDIDEDQSMAERVLLRAEGGGIAMFTTVRLVFTGSDPDGLDNYGLNVELSRQMFTREAGGRPARLGDILFRTKNTAVGAGLNNRKFNLLGDPAMRIGLPERRIEIETPAAFRAFEEATVTGRVLGPDGLPDLGFTGEVDLEVFDALRVVRMPATPSPNALPYLIPRGEYTVQTDALYAGRATVRGGAFSATFRVPQDVSYSGLASRVAAYAVGGGVDGSGASRRAIVAADAGVRPDDGAGPSVRLFLDDTTFVSGGLSRADPVLIARLSDASGINTVGAGVGHEILLTIDGDAATAVDVGRYYAGDLDTYRSGTVRFPLPRLAPGPHTARLTAWDAVNNASTAEVAFTVSEAEGLEVVNVFPYPNPTAGPTRFTFEHNLAPGTAARVQLRVFTLAGRPVRTIDGDDALPGGVLPGGLVQIPWDGRDDDLDRLATGVYLYRLRVEADGADGATQTVERVERLAIIR